MKSRIVVAVVAVAVVSVFPFVLTEQAGASPINTLSGLLPTSVSPSGWSWYDVAPHGASFTDGNYTTTAGLVWYPPSTLTYDLGGSFTLDAFGKADNPGGSDWAAVKTVVIDFSNDSGFATLVGTRTVSENDYVYPGGMSNPPDYDYQLHSFAPITASYARLTVTDTRAHTFGGVTNLNEVELWGQAAVTEAPIPEPATLALLGLGGVALLRRRNRA